MFINNVYANDTITVKDTEVLPQAPSVETNWMSSLVPMILIFVVFYFFLIRPQEKRRRLQEELIGGVKTGEEVMLSSGIFGTVTKINDSDNTIYVGIAKDIEIKVLKSSITDIVSRSKNNIMPKNNIAPKKNKKLIDKA